MSLPPRISIVVPVVGDGAHLQETLDSLAAQEYPALEVLVERGASAAAALDRGFARAGGEILGYLSPGKLLLPRALHDVAGEIDPGAGRYVVMGRAAFAVAGMGGVGVEHPREYLGHFDHLAVWRRGFNAVPNSSLFWHRSVAERVGRFAEGEAQAVDYDFVCRAGREYAVHAVDRLWSAMRVDVESPLTPPEMLGELIRASRRHWGAPWSLLRWKCEVSHRWYRCHPHEHARHHARRAENAAAAGRRAAALWEALKTWVYSPSMARGRLAKVIRGSRTVRTRDS